MNIYYIALIAINEGYSYLKRICLIASNNINYNCTGDTLISYKLKKELCINFSTL